MKTNYNRLFRKFILKSGILLILFLVLISIASATVSNTNPLCLKLSRNLFQGMSDERKEGELFKLQAYLYERGLLSVRPTGYFGHLTKQAVRNLQVSSNLPPTGFVGALTRNTIYKDSCALLRICPDRIVDGPGMPAIPIGGWETEYWYRGKPYLKDSLDITWMKSNCVLPKPESRPM